MTVGMSGDLFRGAQAIGMQIPTALSVSALDYGASVNEDCWDYLLTVNPFFCDQAKKIVSQWLQLSAPEGANVMVQGNPSFAKDAWLMQPIELP